MTDNDNKPPGGKPVAHVVPAILTGAAALIAALTTVYVNVRGDRQSPQPQPEAATAAAAPATRQTTAPVAQAARKLQLQVDRIAVQHDGSPGTTDWRFTVEADGQPLFVFSQDDLDDSGGRNVAVPEHAAGKLLLTPGAPVRISVQGWRGSRLRLVQGAADVHGEGVLAAAGALAPLQVQADDPGDGAFVFYFSAAAVDGGP